jgi:hypothetical protein
MTPGCLKETLIKSMEKIKTDLTQIPNMKHTIIISVAICLIMSSITYSQDPEPSCACDDAELVVDLGGSLKLDYKETNISTMDDGSILLQDKMSGNYFIVKDGVTQGPFKEGDPKIAGFDNNREESAQEQLLLRYKKYISRSGDKFLITFGGKTYGPYGQLSSFALTMSKDKFAALVVENIIATEADGAAMEKAINNAKTDQERMQLAMKYSQQMQQKVMAGGGPASIIPSLVSNVPGAKYDMMTQSGSSPSGEVKYDEIMMVSVNKIFNLQGQQVLTLKNEHIGASKIFVKSNNTEYAIYNYGSVIFSNGKSLTDLFNPHFIKTGGQIYLAYNYYSPKRNALMQCKIPF